MRRRIAAIALILIITVGMGACAKKDRIIGFNPRGFDYELKLLDPPSFNATLQTLDEAICRARHVVIGEVLSTRAMTSSDSRIKMVTVSRVRIRESLLGDLSGEITLVTEGGFMPLDAFNQNTEELVDLIKGVPYIYRTWNYLLLTPEPGGVYLFALRQRYTESVEKILGRDYYVTTLMPYGSALLNGDGKAYYCDIVLREPSEDPVVKEHFSKYIVDRDEYIEQVKALIEKYN